MAGKRPFWIGMAVALGATVAFSSTAFAGHSVRDTVYAPGADIAVSIGADGAIAGNDVAFYVTVSDRSPRAARGVTLTDTIPTGTSLVAAVPEQGSCSASVTTVTCSLGDLPGQGRTLVRVITTTSPTPQILADSAHVTLDSPNDPNKTDNRASGYAQTDPVSRTQTYGYVPPSGGVIGFPHRTSALYPTSLSVRGPRTATGFEVFAYVYDSDYRDGCPDGFTCFGQVADVEGLSGLTPAHPATITLRFDPSEIPGHRLVTHARVFDAYSIVPRCFPSAGSGAAPNPCVASRSVLPNGDWQIVVRTAQRYALIRL